MKHPRVVILLKTWQGPTREIAQNRLESAERMLSSIEKYLEYPNYSWHIADDGSEKWYQDKFKALFVGREYTFTDTKANGNIGLNLNMGMRVALQKTDFVLHWSDDIVLERALDIRPCVVLLRDHDDVGIVSLRCGHHTLDTLRTEYDKAMWHVILHSPRAQFICITSLTLMHRRSWDYYGPYPEGLRIDIMQREMTWRYRNFGDGPKIVAPDDLWHMTMPLCVGISTWDWRLSDEEEQKNWYHYRSYGARVGR